METEIFTGGRAAIYFMSVSILEDRRARIAKGKRFFKGTHAMRDDG